MALQAEAIAQLSLDDPVGSLRALISLHEGIINALSLAEATQGCVSDEFPSAAHQFQHITGCKRSEAQYYLNHVPNHDIRAAIIVWHSQVLKDYLAKYQLPAQQQQQLPPSFKEHEMKEQAGVMRAKAQKASAAADSYEMQDMAQNYLRTNFCSICKVEREVAVTYMEATNYNIIAAVEEYIARHMLHPAQTKDPDSGLAQHKVLLTRHSTVSSTASTEQCSCSCHSVNSNSTLSGPSPAAQAAAEPAAGQQPISRQQQQQQQQYPKINASAPGVAPAVLYPKNSASSTAAQSGSGYRTTAGMPLGQGEASYGLGNLRSRFGGYK